MTSADGFSSPVLLTEELPYVDVKKCIADLPYEFKPYGTSDKICAGDKNVQFSPSLFIIIIIKANV